MSITQNKTTLRVALVGASGAMGQEIQRLASAAGAEVVLRFDAEHPLPELLPEVPVDVAIDFTLPHVVGGNIMTIMGWGLPLVVGTTGWLSELDKVTEAVKESGGKLIWASNFSIGVQAFFRIVRQAAELMEHLHDYDVALHEEHHLRKADSPSGTARTLGEILLAALSRKKEVLTETSHGRISPEALHITSRRLGTIPGTHTVTFDSGADTIELVHRARNRSGFALGALLAAEWIHTAPPGFYCFDEIFEQIIHPQEKDLDTQPNSIGKE
ncbi:MAG: 4-hydroxy-tetrahydrodipicolinate reductase [Ignavibacteriae bacterium]|nr:4-hydroxy-tetrahydrodipicolinate reductase [Ignavibacteriota bacterium]MCB9215423.1 4-hydroxy-tetrahydrodipicolinate reductase [Ignavibacteria bacterium]